MDTNIILPSPDTTPVLFVKHVSDLPRPCYLCVAGRPLEFLVLALDHGEQMLYTMDTKGIARTSLKQLIASGYNVKDAAGVMYKVAWKPQPMDSHA